MSVFFVLFLPFLASAFFVFLLLCSGVCLNNFFNRSGSPSPASLSLLLSLSLYVPPTRLPAYVHRNNRVPHRYTLLGAVSRVENAGALVLR